MLAFTAQWLMDTSDDDELLTDDMDSSYDDSSMEYSEDKNELIDDGNTRHCLCAEAADHYVVKQGNEVSYAVLNDDGNCNGKHRFVKALIAYVFFDER